MEYRQTHIFAFLNRAIYMKWGKKKQQKQTKTKPKKQKYQTKTFVPNLFTNVVIVVESFKMVIFTNMMSPIESNEHCLKTSVLK